PHQWAGRSLWPPRLYGRSSGKAGRWKCLPRHVIETRSVTSRSLRKCAGETGRRGRIGDAVKIMAKDLVRTRRYIKKFITMRANVQAVALKIQTLKSNNSMAQAMKGVTKAMATMNRQLKLPQIQKIMMEFEKQAEIMDMKEELMSDAIDDAMGDEDDEEE
ncbi:charged multivesicular body protein 2a, partial [Nothoprocta perdicaria]|uniref:charged multivesicular body protein 2a n=1 Tax=Nothoprocta perdicaria TaxID=30464 RepID=UPI000E1BBF91